MSGTGRATTASHPASVLVAGRTIGLAASFAIGIVLARTFSPAEFGTYKQFFLVFGTLYGLAQLGMAESLYYFVPRSAAQTGKYVCHALITLAVVGMACTGVLIALRERIAAWLSNPPLAHDMVLLGTFLTCMLMSSVLEIVLVSRKRHVMAAVTYAASDISRTLLFVVPALAFHSLRAVFVGATVFAALRLSLLLASLAREFGRNLRIDVAVWRHQFAYALPFALAVGVEALQINLHQYVVAARFDTATFAMYAVGCLQIPLVDLIVTSTVNVLMVRMAEDSSEGRSSLALIHETVSRLAFLIVPLAVLLIVIAHNLIVTLFTTRYLASVPIFMVWSLTMVPSIFAVDAVLRAHAQTRFLLATNVLRLVLVAALIIPFLWMFGLAGAVLITLLTTALVKAMGVVRIARLMQVPVSEIVPWRRLGSIATSAVLAAVPAFYVGRSLAVSPLAALIAASATYGLTYLVLSYGPAALVRLVAPRPLVIGRRLTINLFGDD